MLGFQVVLKRAKALVTFMTNYTKVWTFRACLVEHVWLVCLEHRWSCHRVAHGGLHGLAEGGGFDVAGSVFSYDYHLQVEEISVNFSTNQCKLGIGPLCIYLVIANYYLTVCPV